MTPKDFSRGVNNSGKSRAISEELGRCLRKRVKRKGFKALGAIYSEVPYNYETASGKEQTDMHEPTRTFTTVNNQDAELRKTLKIVYEALSEKGYNPVNQIVGYILSEDPTYITTHNNARALMSRLDRDDLLSALVRWFIEV